MVIYKLFFKLSLYAVASWFRQEKYILMFTRNFNTIKLERSTKEHKENKYSHTVRYILEKLIRIKHCIIIRDISSQNIMKN